MSSILLTNATIIDTQSSHHLQTRDVLYDNGSVQKIASNIQGQATQVIDAKGKYLAPAWIDLFAASGVPGFEYRESLESLDAAATQGGFGHVALVPNLNPVTDSASDIRFISEVAKGLATKFYPLGAISQNAEGKDLAEMMDMKNAGARAFTDGFAPVQDDLLMLKAMEFIQGMGSTLIQIPRHRNIEAGGLMNEGSHSVAYGMSGAPTMAEEIIIFRDIRLAKYSGLRLHITGITTAASLRLVAQAKEEGVDITCSVTPYHLLYSDEVLAHYDSLYKVYPVLRSDADVQALREGVLTGIVDAITTHHKPHSWDEKVKEFEYAAAGMACIETAWPMLLHALPEISAERWQELLHDAPARILGIRTAPIEEGAAQALTLFDTDTEWTLTPSTKKSAAANVPCLDQILQGKATVLR